MHGKGTRYWHLAGAAGSVHNRDSVHGRRCGLRAGPGVGRGDTELLERGVGAEPRWLRYRGPIHSGGLGVGEHRTPGPPCWRCRYRDSPDDSPPLSRSQHRVAGSPAPSMTSPVGLLSVVPSRAPGFSQHIQPGCGGMRLCSSPGAGTHQHPPVWGPWKGDAPRGSIPGGNSLPKGTHSSRGLTSHNHSTTCGEFSVSKALEKKFGIPLN